MLYFSLDYQWYLWSWYTVLCVYDRHVCVATPFIPANVFVHQPTTQAAYQLNNLSAMLFEFSWPSLGPFYQEYYSFTVCRNSRNRCPIGCRPSLLFAVMVTMVSDLRNIMLVGWKKTTCLQPVPCKLCTLKLTRLVHVRWTSYFTIFSYACTTLI